jgi:hypothetical protein
LGTSSDEGFDERLVVSVVFEMTSPVWRRKPAAEPEALRESYRRLGYTLNYVE